MTLALKKGDPCVAVYGARNGLFANRRQVIRATVKTVGHKWITTNRGRFDRDGRGDYGWSLFADLDDVAAVDEAAELRVLVVDSIQRKAPTLAVLRAVADLLGINATRQESDS